MLPESGDMRADLVRRLRCVEGHLRGIATMIENDADCDSVIRQTIAVRGALREISCRLANHHLIVCLRAHWGDGDAACEQYLADVVSLFSLVAHGDSR